MKVFVKNTFYFEGEVNGEIFTVSFSPNDIYEVEIASEETIRSIVNSSWNLEEIDITIKGKYLD